MPSVIGKIAAGMRADARARVLARRKAQMSDVKKLAKFLTSKGKDISIFVEGDGKYTVASIAPGAAPKAEPSALSAEEQAWEDKFK